MRLNRLVLATAAVTSLALTIPAATPSIAVAQAACDLSLDVLEEASSYRALGIDRSGNVLYRVPGDGHLFLQHPDGTTTSANPYPDQGPWYSESGSLLPDGRVVGYTWWAGSGTAPPDRIRRAFLWDGEAHLLRSGGAYAAFALDANARGTIVGHFRQADGEPTTAAWWRTPDAKMRALPLPAGYTSASAERIDRQGNIYGWGTGPGLPGRQVVWSNGGVSVIDYPHRLQVSDAIKGYAVGLITRKDGRDVPAVAGPDGLRSLPVSRGWTGVLSMVTPSGRYAGTITDNQGNTYNIVGTYGSGYNVVPTRPDTLLVAFHDFDSGTALYQGDIGTPWDVTAAVCTDGA